MNGNPILPQRSQHIGFQLRDNRKPTNKRSRCLGLHCGAVALCTFSWFFLPPSESLMLNGFVVSITYLTLGLIEARRGPPWLTPLAIFFFFFAVQMGIAAIYEGYALGVTPWLQFSRWMIPVKDLATGYLVSLVGMFAMHAGLEASRHGLSSTPPLRPQQSKFPFLTFGILWALGLFATYLPLIVVHLGTLGVFFQYGGLAALLPLAFLDARQLNISRVTHGVLFAAGTFGLLAASAASQNSSKMTIVLALLPTAGLLVRTKRYRKLLPIPAVAGLLLYLAVIAPAINGSRTIATLRGMTAWDKVVQSAETNSLLAGAKPASDFLLEQFGSLMDRIFESPTATGFLVSEVERTGLQMGNTMLGLEYAFIPRVLWPEKPIVSRGAWFTTYLGMAPRAEEATSSTGMTAFGEWYWNFGIVGEVLGMFLVGLLQGGLWHLAGDYPLYDPARMLLYVAVIVNMVMLPEASTVLVTAVALYILFGTVLLFRKIANGFTGAAQTVGPRTNPRSFLRHAS